MKGVFWNQDSLALLEAEVLQQNLKKTRGGELMLSSVEKGR